MWIDHTIKCPDTGHWYAVIRVDEDGNHRLVRYLSPAVHADLIDKLFDDLPRPATDESHP